MIKFIKIFIILLIQSGLAHSDNSELGTWQNNLKVDKDGIKVYVYSHPDFGVAAFKAISHIDSSLDSILAVISDTKSCSDWLYTCNVFKTIKNVNFNERYYYLSIDLPFPFNDRDFIFRSKIIQNPDTKIVTINIYSTSNYCNKNHSQLCIKIKKHNLVRVHNSFITFKFEPVKSGTKMTWIQYTDPDGKLPSWLVNQFIENTPYKSLKKLTDIVKEEKYQYAKVLYDLQR